MDKTELVTYMLKGITGELPEDMQDSVGEKLTELKAIEIDINNEAHVLAMSLFVMEFSQMIEGKQKERRSVQ